MSESDPPALTPAGQPPFRVFEGFFDRSKVDDPELQLLGLVKAGLYAESECRWAAELPSPPNQALISQFHQIASNPHSRAKLETEAKHLIADYSGRIVRLNQRDVLRTVIEDVTEGIHRSKTSLWRGVGEAVLGAFFYTILLVVLSLMAKRFGIDLLEIYSRLSGRG